MTAAQQRAELHKRIWDIANNVRARLMDGILSNTYWVHGCFTALSVKTLPTTSKPMMTVWTMLPSPMTVLSLTDIKDDHIKVKGYFIYPSQLFKNVAANANNNDSLNTKALPISLTPLKHLLMVILPNQISKGYSVILIPPVTAWVIPSTDKNKRLAAVLKGVEELDFGDFENNQIDLFGDAYEFLISNYAANAGKSNW